MEHTEQKESVIIEDMMYAVWERPDIQSEGLPTSLASLLSTWSPVFFELYILHAVISDISKSGEGDAMGREPCVFDSMLINISMKLCRTQCILHIEYTYIYIHGWRRLQAQWGRNPSLRQTLENTKDALSEDIQQAREDVSMVWMGEIYL
jgi:hypothetical protein